MWKQFRLLCERSSRYINHPTLLISEEYSPPIFRKNYDIYDFFVLTNGWKSAKLQKTKSILNISENFCTINSIEGMWGINKS